MIQNVSQISTFLFSQGGCSFLDGTFCLSWHPWIRFSNAAVDELLIKSQDSTFSVPFAHDIVVLATREWGGGLFPCCFVLLMAGLDLILLPMIPILLPQFINSWAISPSAIGFFFYFPVSLAWIIGTVPLSNGLTTELHITSKCLEDTESGGSLYWGWLLT